MAFSRLTAVLAGVAVLLPVGFYAVLGRIKPGREVSPPVIPATVSFEPSTLPFQKSSLGKAPVGRPLITNVQIFDLDRDGKPDVLVCDAVLQRVIWHRQTAPGVFEEHILGDTDISSPCHVEVTDLNGDGHLDIVVAGLGSVFPTDEAVGSVVWLESDGKQNFKTHVLMTGLRRVADVRAGDLNGDGKPDLVVAEFGYLQGSIRWLENKGNGQFRDHELWAVPGCIHCPILDLNGDGKPDIVALVSQDDEEVVVFENKGNGEFKRRSLYRPDNFDLGSSGLFVADLDQDGKPDLLLTTGDNLEIYYPAPQPWHGCVWLRNRGDGTFEPKQIGHLPGTYAAGVGDLDGDGDLDVVLVGMFNDWHNPAAASVVWLENDGKQNFTTRQIDTRPSHLATVAVGDLNGDGRADIVAGSLHLQGPFNRLGRVTLWLSQPEGKR
ncbi:FG-GAP repeat domain-containing protein [Zavarzinella formosa]|uniref:FG-GAP repeat domain-containing protein n=1 Tax=Zavarzinella formosa TaxID=360055 RepID=UPI000306E350|nr:VCBS repeat-containing protein [Zavarzinella formosa]